MATSSVTLSPLSNRAVEQPASTVANPNAGVLLAAGASTNNTVNITNNTNSTGLILVINVTTATVATLQFTLTATTLSGYSYTIIQSASLNATGTTVLRVAPGLTAAANVTVNDLITPSMSLGVVITGTVAYGVDYILTNSYQ